MKKAWFGCFSKVLDHFIPNYKQFPTCYPVKIDLWSHRIKFNCMTIICQGSFEIFENLLKLAPLKYLPASYLKKEIVLGIPACVSTYAD